MIQLEITPQVAMLLIEELDSLVTTGPVRPTLRAFRQELRIGLREGEPVRLGRDWVAGSEPSEPDR